MGRNFELKNVLHKKILVQENFWVKKKFDKFFLGSKKCFGQTCKKYYFLSKKNWTKQCLVKKCFS